MTRRVGAYAKLLATYASDDAIIAAGEAAELLFVRGLAFCATSDSDGYITDGQLVRVVGAGMRDAPRRAARLVTEGLWERCDDGYQVRSWLKIHEAAEEKGRKRRTDRERKQRGRTSDSDDDSERNPSGQGADSERIPEGVTPDSLLCSYVSSSSGTEQSTTEQSSARNPAAAATAQVVIGEWIERCRQRPPARVIGQMSREIKNLLDEGIEPDIVRAGVAEWMTKDVSPSVLPSIVNSGLNRRATANGNGTRRTTDDKVRDGLELARRLATPDDRQIGAGA